MTLRRLRRRTPDPSSSSGRRPCCFRLGPFTVLTDPNFLHQGESVGLGYGMLRSKRLTEPAISIDALPPLDMVVLSHHHEDHFDRVATERLDRSVPILTTPDAARALRKVGFRNARSLRTWQQQSFVRGDWLLTVTALPGTHGPAMMMPFLPSVMGSLLELRQISKSESLRIYITGDTLVHEQLAEIPSRFPGIDLALLHLGGTRIFGVLLTMDGKQGVEAIRLVNPEIAVPIHYDDYDVFQVPAGGFSGARCELPASSHGSGTSRMARPSRCLRRHAKVVRQDSRRRSVHRSAQVESGDRMSDCQARPGAGRRRVGQGGHRDDRQDRLSGLGAYLRLRAGRWHGWFRAGSVSSTHRPQSGRARRVAWDRLVSTRRVVTRSQAEDHGYRPSLPARARTRTARRCVPNQLPPPGGGFQPGRPGWPARARSSALADIRLSERQP